LVRFCRCEGQLHAAGAQGFNPTLVRFCQTRAQGAEAMEKRFQSHLGSILPRALPCPARGRRRFNPTLVRFCLSHALRTPPSCTSFNPTLVRFCPIGWRCACGDIVGFNPTLVRFCPGLAQAVQARRMVSIPPWFDFASSGSEGRFCAFVVSIPPWFDFAPAGAGAKRWRRWRFQSHLGSILPTLQNGSL